MSDLYLAHFGLHAAPFGITPDPAFFYAGNSRGALLDALLYAITQGEGMLKLTGEVGSGKTMLCRMLVERLPPQVNVLYLLNPRLDPEQVMHAIGDELGLQLDGLRSDAVLRALHAELIARHAAGRQVLLLAEEAQAMPVETLEAVRLLTNLETASHKLLQIMLVGQPELDQTLAQPQLRQLKERIGQHFAMPSLPPALLPDYLACRLAAAGRAAPQPLSRGALRLLARASQGTVRRVNILADKALLAAYADDAQQVHARHLRQAIADSGLRLPPWHAGRAVACALILSALLLAGLLAWRMVTASPAAAPATLQPASAPHAASTVLLDAALQRSQAWLAQQSPQHLVLRIASLPAADTDGAEAFLQQAQQAIGLQDIHVFRLGGAPGTRATPQLAIMYGSYAEKASAEAVSVRMASLSPEKILLNDISSIREEILSAAPPSR